LAGAAVDGDAGVDAHDGVVDDLDAVAADLAATGGEQRGRWHPVAGEVAVHVAGGGVARRPGVDHCDSAPGTSEDEGGGQAGGSATNDHDVIGLRVHA
jgi:hypothetical protein